MSHLWASSCLCIPSLSLWWETDGQVCTNTAGPQWQLILLSYFVRTEHLKILPRANTMFVFSFQSFPSCLEHVHCRSVISTMLVFQHPAEGRSCSPGEKSRGLTQTPPSPGDGVSPGTGWAYQGLTSASRPPCSLPQGPPAHCPMSVPRPAAGRMCLSCALLFCLLLCGEGQ